MLTAHVNLLDQLGMPLWGQGVVLVLLGSFVAATEWEADRDARQLIRAQLGRQHTSSVTIRRDWSTLQRPLVYDVRFLTSSGERAYNRCTIDLSADVIVRWHEPLNPSGRL